MATPAKFSQLLRDWRQARGLSRADAARKLGVPYRTLENWESEWRTPRGIARRLIAEKIRRLN